MYFCTRKSIYVLIMNQKICILLLSLFMCCGSVIAQDVANSRSSHLQAYKDYASKGETRKSVESGVKATSLYYKENLYHEAFELLHRIEATIAGSKLNASDKAGLYYLTTKERLQMYMKMRKVESAKEQLGRLETLANQSGDEAVKNDLLYNKAIYYYTFGLNEKGNAVFKEMAAKLTASKDYDKVDEVYQTLISNGRKSNNASLVAQSYSNYIAWKDSANAMKHADEIADLKKQIADHEATIADKDSSLTARWATIVGLIVLAVALAAGLIAVAMVLMRYMLLTRKQKKTIKLANESNALKAKFISNIAAQLEPTFKKLDSRVPEVKALLDFSSHIQTLSQLENTDASEVEFEETPIQQFSEELVDQIRDKVKKDVTLTVNVPKMNVNINKEYVSHILLHLLNNAAEYTPEGGRIWLDFKKRSPRAYQYVISNTGAVIPEEEQEEVFKPFREIHDLTEGDGLGLPICKQMALKMNGDLDIDSGFTKGVRFMFDLHV